MNDERLKRYSIILLAIGVVAFLMAMTMPQLGVYDSDFLGSAWLGCVLLSLIISVFRAGAHSVNRTRDK